VESQPGAGARFCVALPRQAALEAPTPPESGGELPAATSAR